MKTSSLKLMMILASIFLITCLLPHQSMGDTYILIPSNDAPVSDGYPDTNYGTLQSLSVHSTPGGLTNRSYLMFDLTSIPASETITSANLYLFCTTVGYDENPIINVDLHHVLDDSWSENSLTWNNMPSYDTTAMDQQTMPDPSPWGGGPMTWVYWNVDITKMTDGYLSLLLKLSDEESDTQQAFFFSKDYISDRPYLEVNTTTSAVTEPSTMLLLGSGLIGLWGFRKKFKK